MATCVRESSNFFATSTFLPGHSTSNMYRSRSCSLTFASARAFDCARRVFGSNSAQMKPAGKLVCCRSTDKCNSALNGELIVWLDLGRIRQESTPSRIRCDSGNDSQFQRGAGAGVLLLALGLREQPQLEKSRAMNRIQGKAAEARQR